MSGTVYASVPVVFDYEAWAARYPELDAQGNAPQAQMFFNEATLYLDNTACSPVSDPTQRAVILNQITAHIAALNGPQSSPLVGRISSATEGSVNVSTEYAAPGSAAWWSQTKYGAAAWQALAAYRTMQYLPALCSAWGRPSWR